MWHEFIPPWLRRTEVWNQSVGSRDRRPLKVLGGTLPGLFQLLTSNVTQHNSQSRWDYTYSSHMCILFINTVWLACQCFLLLIFENYFIILYHKCSTHVQSHKYNFQRRMLVIAVLGSLAQSAHIVQTVSGHESLICGLPLTHFYLFSYL